MKKKLLLTALMLSMGSMMLTGLTVPKSIDEIMEKYAEASKNITKADVSVDLNLEAGISMTSKTIGTQSMNFGFLGDLNVAFQTATAPEGEFPPISAKVDGSMELNIPDEHEAIQMEYYLITDEIGDLENYVKVSDGDQSEWQYLTVPAEQLEQIIGMVNPAQTDFSQMPGELSLSPGFSNVDGSSCYHVILTLTYDDIEPLLTQIMEATGEEMDSDALTLAALALNGLKLNAEMDIDANSYLIKKLHIDMDESDLSGLNAILAYAMAQNGDDGLDLPKVSIDISNLYMDYIYDYDSPVEISIPQEALAAKAKQTSAVG